MTDSRAKQAKAVPPSLELYTVAEVCEMLQVSPKLVRTWIHQGALRAFRFGPRHIRIRRTDLEAFLAGGFTAEPKVEPGEGGPC